MSGAEYYDFVCGAEEDAAHPNGDLDRIILDREIMTVRSGYTNNRDKNGDPIPRANIPRGEDIVYMMQNNLARKRILDRDREAGTFTRKLSNSQVYNELAALERLCQREWWIDDPSGIPDQVDYENETNVAFLDYLRDHVQVEHVDYETDADSERSIKRSTIEDALKTYPKMMCTCLYRGSYSGISMICEIGSEDDIRLNTTVNIHYKLKDFYSEIKEDFSGRLIFRLSEHYELNAERTLYVLKKTEFEPIGFIRGELDGFYRESNSLSVDGDSPTLSFDKQWIDLASSRIVFQIHYSYNRRDDTNDYALQSGHGDLFLSYKLSAGVTIRDLYEDVEKFAESKVDMSDPPQDVEKNLYGRLEFEAIIYGIYFIMSFYSDLTIEGSDESQ